MRELQREIGTSLSGIDHHLRVLEKQGAVVTISDGHFRRCFSSSLALPSEARLLNDRDRAFLAECRRPVSLAIVLCLAVEGPLRHGEIQRRIGKSKGTVTYHLSRLVDRGFVLATHQLTVETYELADPSRAVSLLVTFSGEFRDHADGLAHLWSSLAD